MVPLKPRMTSPEFDYIIGHSGAAALSFLVPTYAQMIRNVAGRPHVKLVHEDDYVWHAAQSPGGEVRAGEPRLSVDQKDCSSSLPVDSHTDWGRGPGIHHANTEFYVVHDQVTYGDRRIGKGSYLYLPKGVPVESVQFNEGRQAGRQA